MGREGVGNHLYKTLNTQKFLVSMEFSLRETTLTLDLVVMRIPFGRVLGWFSFSTCMEHSSRKHHSIGELVRTFTLALEDLFHRMYSWKK